MIKTQQHNSAQECWFESMEGARPGETDRAPMFPTLVGAVGLEPTFPKEADFKSAASANSATLPCEGAASCGVAIIAENVRRTLTPHSRLQNRWASPSYADAASMMMPCRMSASLTVNPLVAA